MTNLCQSSPFCILENGHESDHEFTFEPQLRRRIAELEKENEQLKKAVIRSASNVRLALLDIATELEQEIIEARTVLAEKKP